MEIDTSIQITFNSPQKKKKHWKKRPVSGERNGTDSRVIREAPMAKATCVLCVLKWCSQAKKLYQKSSLVWMRCYVLKVTVMGSKFLDSYQHPYQPLFGLGASLSYRRRSRWGEFDRPFSWGSREDTPFQSTCFTISVLIPMWDAVLELRVHLCLFLAPPC